jgi:hypothetical protein
MAAIVIDDDDPIEDVEENSQNDGSPAGTQPEAGASTEWKTIFGERHPRQPQVAFDFGHLCRHGLIAQEWYAHPLNEDDLKYNNWEQEFHGIAVEILYACKNLFIEFDLEAVRELDRKVIDLDKQFCHIAYDGGQKSEQEMILRTQSDLPGEEIWHDLCRLADKALPESSPLRSLYDLGAALGDYQWRLSSLRQPASDLVRFDTWPDIEPLARSLRALPAVLTARVPLLDSLAWVSQKKKSADRAVFLKAFLESVEEYFPLVLPEEALDFRDEPRYKASFLFRMFAYVNHLLEPIGFAAIDRSPQSMKRKLEWHPQTGKLVAGGAILRKVKSDATNIRIVLDNFQKAGWEESITNPFLLETVDSDPMDALREAIRGLNTSIKEIRFRGSEGYERVCWDPS